MIPNILPNHAKPTVTYTGKKVSSYFQNKEKANFKYSHDVMHYDNVQKHTV